MNKEVMQIQTPLGEFSWVTISGKGKDYVSKLGKSDNNYKYFVSIMLSKQDGAKLIKDIETEYSNSSHYLPVPDGRRPYYVIAKEQTEVNSKGNQHHVIADIGKVVFKFSTGTKWPDGGHKSINVYNSRGIDITEDFKETKIANGSLGCVNGTFGIYDRGCTLYLDAIQIAKLIEYKQGNGFADVGEGYTGNENKTFAPVTKLEL
tara:strand:- start:1782 stop:2396 length:615 start_codon:yes stop_codon:yes gene_type:complete